MPLKYIKFCIGAKNVTFLICHPDWSAASEVQYFRDCGVRSNVVRKRDVFCVGRGRYLYLTPEDYSVMEGKGAVRCEKIVDEGETRFRILVSVTSCAHLLRALGVVVIHVLRLVVSGALGGR